MPEVALNDDHVERLKRPVGTIVLYWGLIDVMITDVAIRTFVALKRPEATHTIPTPFTPRLEVIKRNLEQSELETVRERTLQALEVISNLKELRETLVHGTAVAYDPDGDAILFSKIDRLTNAQKLKFGSPSASHQLQRTKVNFRALDEMADRCLKLQAFLASLLDKLDEV